MRIPRSFRMPSTETIDRLFVAFILLVIAWSVHDRLGIQPFWDEPKIYLRPLLATLDDPFAYFLGPVTPRDRPPGLNFLYAPFLWLFGESIFLIRALSVSYFTAGLWLFYRAMKSERMTGATVILIFLTVPLVRVYIPQLVGDPQLFMAFAFHFYFLGKNEKRLWPLVFSGFFAGLLREPALALIPATLAYLYLEKRKVSVKELIVSFAPAAGLSVHLLRNFVKSGEFFHHVTITSGDLDPLASLAVRYRNIFEVLLGNYHLIPLVLISSFIILSGRRKLKLTPETGFALVISFLYLVVFSGLHICLPRYFMPAVPFLILIFVAQVLRVLPSLQLRLVFTLFSIISIAITPSPKPFSGALFPHGTGYQDTMDYPKLAVLHRDLIESVKGNLPEGSLILAGWPFNEILKSTRLGYGPLINFDVVTRTHKMPDAMIWTNFPQQIPWRDIEKFVATGEYERKDYSLGVYEARVFFRKN